jgi:ABC-2 type transport system ATP-binding protein
MVLDHGTIIANDTPARLKAELAGDRISIELTRPAETADAAEIAGRLPAARELKASGTSVAVTVRNGEAALPELIRHLQRRGIEIAAATVKRPTLDDVFLGLTGRSLRETAAA